jgi:hypothetical protein
MGTAIGLFCNNCGFFLIISWLPFHLVKAQGNSNAAMAEAVTLVGLICRVCVLPKVESTNWLHTSAHTNAEAETCEHVEPR